MFSLAEEFETVWLDGGESLENITMIHEDAAEILTKMTNSDPDVVAAEICAHHSLHNQDCTHAVLFAVHHC